MLLIYYSNINNILQIAVLLYLLSNKCKLGEYKKMVLKKKNIIKPFHPKVLDCSVSHSTEYIDPNK